MITKEEINARIRKSTELYKFRRETQKQTIKDRKDGIAFIHEHKLPIMTKELFDDSILVLTVTKPECLENDYKKYRFAYALCSPKDKFSLKTAKGLIGKRLIDKDTNFTFEITLAKNKFSYKGICVEALLNVGFTWIAMQALTNADTIPDCLRRTMVFAAKYPSYSTNYYI